MFIYLFIESETSEMLHFVKSLRDRYVMM